MTRDISLDQLVEFATTVPGYFAPSQLLGLARLTVAAMANAPGGLLEIGSYCGRSTVVLGTLSVHHGRHLITVDRHLGSVEMLPPFPYFDPAVIDRVHHRLDSLPLLMDTLELAGLRDQITVLVTRSNMLTTLLRPGFAMIMIDGGHDPLSTWTDYLTARQLLAHDGTLIIDDVFEDPADGGRPPYEVMVAALHSGFQIVDREGPLVALRQD
ncbi:MAG: class I SAM-dependent methyltransferase [Ferrimicrobium sp.]|uniref:Class I SAM-dependent methyltransferase n=1 Tax=Ferrimicrobium acidiphilum TaxID=121039 RepID=A0ABV3Y2H1_9ACTN|nr:class I SAM-dependent methyltransferase [Ferrimicrobium sp.]MCL5974114.1 class I SAM-dependent methyltransferase [Actinomycetota bacterium]